jgi:PKD repeat protein
MKRISIFLLLATLLGTSCKKETITEPNTETDTTDVNNPQPLEAKFSITVSDVNNIFENQPIKFNNLSTGYTTQVWEFGNSTKSRLTSPEITYPVHGYYSVKLIVFDDKGNRSESVQDISILCNFGGGIHPAGG